MVIGFLFCDRRREETYRRNGQEVCYERVESQRPQCQRQIGTHRALRNKCNEPNGIHRPQVKLLDHLPKAAGGDGLAVVHVALAGVIPQHAIHHDGHLSVVEPPLGAEPSLCLHDGRGHIEKRGESDEERYQALDEKQPSPTSPAADTTQTQKCEGQQRGDN